MRTSRYPFLVLTAGTLLALASCGNDGAPPAHSHGGTTSEPADCGGKGELFSAGMTKATADGTVQVVLVKSDVAPPAQGLNTWTLEVKGPDGPLAGAKVTASASMPGHPHPARVYIAKETEPGIYEVVPYFSMPLLWETTVTVVAAGGKESSVTFSFCIP